VGPRGKGRRDGSGKGGRGREGRESRNAEIQSWQAYDCLTNISDVRKKASKKISDE